MFLLPCSAVRHYFRIKTMFDSYLHTVVCRRVHVLFILFVFVAYSAVHVLTVYMIWVTWRMSYKRKELITLREHLSAPTVFWWWFVLLIFRGLLCVVLLCVFTFWVRCCDVSYDFRMKTMISSPLPPVVCRWALVLFTFFVFVCI